MFEWHFSQSSFTKTSVASLFTSQYPDTHLALGRRTYAGSPTTLARGLGEAGFETALFSRNPQAGPPTGNGAHFEEAYTDRDVSRFRRANEGVAPPEALLRLFSTWLGKTRDRRFFAYIHFIPPHLPYKQPREMTALFEGKRPPNYDPGRYRPGQCDFGVKLEMDDRFPPLPEWINLYDANLRYADWLMGEVGRVLRDAKVYDSTLLVITSDHGEAFGEHGYVEHQSAIHDEATHIPLILRFPKGAVARRVEGLSQTIDVLPTLFELLNVPYRRDGVQGRSLVPLITGEADSVNDYVFLRSYIDPRSHGRPGDQNKAMVRGRQYALLLYGNGRWRALYDLGADPEQRRNIIEEQPGRAQELLEVFKEFARVQANPITHFADPSARPAPLPKAPSVELTPETKRQLEALGYVN